MPRRPRPADPRTLPAAPERDSEQADPSKSGVDDTLIRWMLSLSPTERLQWAQEMVDTVDALRNGREP